MKSPVNKLENKISELNIEELEKIIREFDIKLQRSQQSNNDKFKTFKNNLRTEIVAKLKEAGGYDFYWNYAKLEGINLAAKTNQKKWEVFLKKVEKKDPKILAQINQLGVLETERKDKEKEIKRQHEILVKDFEEVWREKTEKEVERLEESKELENERKKEELRQKILKNEGSFIIFVDGKKNNWGGKYGITDEKGNKIESGNNGQIYEQIEIEAYSILKGVNWAVDNNIKHLKIMTDCQVLSYGEDFKSKTKAGKYYWLARKIAKDNGIELEFEWVRSKDNLADYLTRE